jgi:hypothetical protein
MPLVLASAFLAAFHGSMMVLNIAIGKRNQLTTNTFARDL